MSSRMRRALGLVFAILVATAADGAAKDTSLATIPFPSVGNVTVARLTIAAGRAGSPSPKLDVAGRNAFRGTAFVAATVGRSNSRRFQATVAVFNPVSTVTPSQSAPVANVVVRLPAGFTLAGSPQIARDVLYTNPIPSFPFVAGGVGSILAGALPSLPPSQIVRDAQQLALERSVPLVDVGLLGLQYVSAQFLRIGAATLKATIGLYQKSQVNAVELGFPIGTKVVQASGPPATDALLLGNTIRLISSSGFFQDGIQYSFVLRLNKLPNRGDFVILRASTHYFEGSLPFTERFALP